MRKSESSRRHVSRAQSVDSSQAFNKPRALIVVIFLVAVSLLSE